MEKRKLNNNDELSLLGFGCMRLPILNGDYQQIDRVNAEDMVDFAISNGINYFDTAYAYHNGNSEPFIGDALKKYPSSSYKLATKMPPWFINDHADLERIFTEQLKKCGTDYFDYYLIHGVSTSTIKTIEDYNFYDFLQQKKNEGVIRNLGFSFHDTPEFLKSYIEKYCFDFAQIQLNYMDWEMQDAKKSYEYLTEKGLDVIVMEPIRGGTLANLNEKARTVLYKANPEISPAAWALRFVASLPKVVCILSGMSNMEQLVENCCTLTNFRPLEAAEYESLFNALKEYRLSSPIPCTACGYCMDCPSGVDIPKVFGLYNLYKNTENTMTYQMNLQQLGEAKQAHNCIACELCLDKCPQKLEIAKLMELINDFNNDLAEKTHAR